jgi:hypothetical protein
MNTDLIPLIPVYLFAGAFVIEKGLALYRRVMADGKVTLDEITEIVEEVEEVVEAVKEMVEDGE